MIYIVYKNILFYNNLKVEIILLQITECFYIII